MVSNEYMASKQEETDAEFQVEIHPSSVSDAAQRLKRAITLALLAAARTGEPTQSDLSQTPKASDSE